MAEQLAHRLGGVAEAGERRVQDPAELRLRAAGLAGDLVLRPGVLSPEHEVADDRVCRVVAQGDDDRGGEAVGVREQFAVVGEVGGAAGEPLVDGVEPAVLPGRGRVVGGGGAQGEPLGVQRTLDGRPEAPDRCVPGPELGDDGADVA